MAKIPFSSSSNAGGSFTPWPEGTYDCKITETEFGSSKAGNPQLRVRLECVAGPYAGKQSNVWYSLLPKAAWKLNGLLEALSIEKEDTGQVDEAGQPIETFDDEWLLGRVVQYDLKHREYNGKTQMDFLNERASEYDAATSFEDNEVEEAPPPPPPVATLKRRPRPAVS